jgi:hypothetical protein
MKGKAERQSDRMNRIYRIKPRPVSLLILSILSIL